LSNINFKQTVGSHIWASDNGKIEIIANYTISGQARQHYYANSGGIIRVQGYTVTLSGTQSYSNFAASDFTALLIANNNTYTGGTVSGKRYDVSYAGQIITLGGANYFPGSIAGTQSSDGKYV
jgi:hypothetical protein